MDEILQTLLAQHGLVVLAILFAAAALEYLFPPFPGDSVTLVGAVLVAAYDRNLVAVYLAVTAGSVAGAMADFALGVWWRKRRAGATRSVRVRQQIDRLVAGFQRHGEAYLVINRFLPGVRAFFFIAAGLAHMRPARVALFAGLSAAAWNALILALGYAVGRNLELLEDLLRSYTNVAWALLALVVLAAVARALWKRRRADG